MGKNKIKKIKIPFNLIGDNHTRPGNATVNLLHTKV
jgi:hypothetical protein